VLWVWIFMRSTCRFKWNVFWRIRRQRLCRSS
jgi:hypothetical protein